MRATRDLSTYERNGINSVIIKGCPCVGCPNYQTQMTCEALTKHLKTACPQIKREQTCFCGQQIDNEDTIENHFLECEKILIACNDCNVCLRSLEAFKEHSCCKLYYQRQIIKSENQRQIDKIKSDNQRQIDEIKLDFESQRQINTKELTDK